MKQQPSQPAPFPSLAWCQRLADAIHADPRSALAGKGWHGTVCVAFLQDDLLDVPFFVYARIQDGRVLELRQLEDEDEIDEIAPDYVAKAKCDVWLRFVRGECDPIEALIQKKISFRGDLTPIAERAQFKQLIWDTLAKVPAAIQGGGQ